MVWDSLPLPMPYMMPKVHGLGLLATDVCHVGHHLMEVGITLVILVHNMSIIGLSYLSPMLAQ